MEKNLTSTEVKEICEKYIQRSKERFELFKTMANEKALTYDELYIIQRKIETEVSAYHDIIEEMELQEKF